MKPIRYVGCIILGLSAVANSQDVEVEAARQDAINAQLSQDQALRFFLGYHPEMKHADKCSKCHAQQGREVINTTNSDAELWRYFTTDRAMATEAGISATFTAPDETTRTLLSLPTDAGLVVTSVCPEKNDDLPEFQKNDIVLSVNSKPVKSEKDIAVVLKEAGEVTVDVLRSGKEKKLIRKRVTRKETKSEERYLIGIRLGELEPVVRSQLGLEEHVSVVITEVQEESAASDVDIKVNDIVLEVNGEKVEAAASIQEAVQQSNGDEVVLLLFRDKKQHKVSVKPRMLETETAANFTPIYRYIDLDAPMISNATDAVTEYRVVPVESDLQQRLRRIEKRLDELKSLLERADKESAAKEKQ